MPRFEAVIVETDARGIRTETVLKPGDKVKTFRGEVVTFDSCDARRVYCFDHPSQRMPREYFPTVINAILREVGSAALVPRDVDSGVRALDAIKEKHGAPAGPAPAFTAVQIKALELLCEMADSCLNLNNCGDWRGSQEGKAALRTVEALIAKAR